MSKSPASCGKTRTAHLEVKSKPRTRRAASPSRSNAYAVGKKEKPPFAPQDAPVVVPEEPIPNELLCLICHELLSDAVVIPCCGNSFCDDCESRQNAKKRDRA